MPGWQSAASGSCWRGDKCKFSHAAAATGTGQSTVTLSGAGVGSGGGGGLGRGITAASVAVVVVGPKRASCWRTAVELMVLGEQVVGRAGQGGAVRPGRGRGFARERRELGCRKDYSRAGAIGRTG